VRIVVGLSMLRPMRSAHGVLLKPTTCPHPAHCGLHMVLRVVNRVSLVATQDGPHCITTCVTSALTLHNCILLNFWKTIFFYYVADFFY